MFKEYAIPFFSSTTALEYKAIAVALSPARTNQDSNTAESKSQRFKLSSNLVHFHLSPGPWQDIH